MFVAVVTEQAFDYVLILTFNEQHLSAFETDLRWLVSCMIV